MNIEQALTYYQQQKGALAQAITESKSRWHIQALQVNTAIAMRRQAILNGIGRQYRDDQLIAALTSWQACMDIEGA